MLFKIAGIDIDMEAGITEDTPEEARESLRRSTRARLGRDLSAVLSLWKFSESTQRYQHAKVDEVIPKLLSYHEQRKHAGVKSGQARRERAFNERSTAVQTSFEPPPDPSPDPSPSTEPVDNTERVVKATSTVATPKTNGSLSALQRDDPIWTALRSAAARWGAPLVEEDWSQAHFSWAKLDLDQRRVALENLCARADRGDDPGYFRPQKYLSNGEWKRPVTPFKSRDNAAAGKALEDSTFERLARKEAERAERNKARSG